MDVIRRLLIVLLLASAPLAAQGPNPPAQTSASLSSATSLALNVSGYASVAFQITGTWTGTITFEGSIDGSTYQTINVTLTNGTSAVTTTTGNGVWTGSVGGLRSVRARFSTYSSGTAVISIQAAASGGGSGGGGGGAASSVTINDPSVTTQKAAVNASGQLSITCANCSGSGASAVDNSTFTAGSTSGAPAMGFFHSTIDAVTDGSTATLGMDAKRNLFTVLRDAAGNARGVNVTAGNALTVDASATTQPVSGTVTAAQATAANLNATVVGTGTFATQAAQSGTWNITNVSGTVSLPTGAATAAKQPALGTAGTSSADVITVQGRAAMTPLLVDGSGATQPISGTVTANQGGTWTVQPGNTANTTAWKVDGSAVTQPVSISGNQAVNVAQINGVTPLMGNGASGTGAQRVTIANDSTGILALTTGSAQIGHLEANQSTNVAQINGVTPLMGAGATGTGAQRTNDVASSATGAAPPASAAFVGGLGSGATGGFLVGAPFCDSTVPISITSATTTLIVTGVSGRHVYICHLDMVTAIANNVAVITGTGATCGTSTAGVFGGSTAANGWNFAANGGIALGSGIGMVGRTETTGDSICIITSAAGPLAGAIVYAIY